MLNNYLPLFMRNNLIYKAIFQAESNQITHLEINTDDLKAQLNVSTATWALDIYEKELGMPTNTLKPYSERRSVILSKMKGTGKFNSTLIKAVALSWTGGQIDVSFNGKINITFTDVVGIPPNIQDFYNAIEEIKPVYLDVIYTFMYNQYQDLIGFTYNYLSGFTYEQIRSSSL